METGIQGNTEGTKKTKNPALPMQKSGIPYGLPSGILYLAFCICCLALGILCLTPFLLHHHQLIVPTAKTDLLPMG